MDRSRITNVVAVLVLLIVSVVVMKSITPYGSATSPDSLSYLDIAANLKNGDGFVETDYSLGSFQASSFNEQRAWPSLYPRLLSLVVENPFDVKMVSVVSTLLFFGVLYFVFLIVNTKNNAAHALITSLLLGVTVPLVTVYTYAWSETLFILLLVISAWSTIKYLEADPSSASYRIFLLLVTLLVLISLAYTRYIGVVFSVLLVAVYFMGGGRKKHRLTTLLAILIYAVSVGYMLLDNYMATGYVSGMPRAASDKSVMDNLVDIVNVVLAIIPSSFLQNVVSLVITIVLVVGLREVSKRLSYTKDVVARRRAFVLALIGGIYLVSLVVSRSVSNFDALDVRLLSPVFVMVFVLLSLMCSCVSIHAKPGVAVGVVAIFMSVSFAVKGTDQVFVAMNSWSKYESPMHILSNNRAYNNFTASDATTYERRKAFSDMVMGSGVVVADRPKVWRFITGVKSFQKPQNLNSKAILQLNSLPENSLMMVSKGEWEPLKTEMRGWVGSVKYINFGDVIAVRLPL